MNTYKWLLKREFWEHKGGFLWAQVVVGALIALGITVSASVMKFIGSHHGMSSRRQCSARSARKAFVDFQAIVSPT